MKKYLFLPIGILLLWALWVTIWSRTDSYAEEYKKELGKKLNMKNKYSHINQFNTPIIVPDSSIDYSMIIVKPNSNFVSYMPITHPDKGFEFNVLKMVPDSSEVLDLSKLRTVSPDSFEVFFKREQIFKKETEE